MKIQAFKPDEPYTTLLYVEIMKIFEIYYLIQLHFKFNDIHSLIKPAI